MKMKMRNHHRTDNLKKNGRKHSRGLIMIKNLIKCIANAFTNVLAKGSNRFFSDSLSEHDKSREHQKVKSAVNESHLTGIREVY